MATLNHTIVGFWVLTAKVKMSSDMLRAVVRYIFTDVSEETQRPHKGGSTHH